MPDLLSTLAVLVGMSTPVALGVLFLALGGWAVPFAIADYIRERRATRPGAPRPRYDDWVKPSSFRMGYARRRYYKQILPAWRKNNRRSSYAARVVQVDWKTPEAAKFMGAMRQITLRYPAVCAQCGKGLDVGTRARWHPESKVVLHLQQRCLWDDEE